VPDDAGTADGGTRGGGSGIGHGNGNGDGGGASDGGGAGGGGDASAVDASPRDANVSDGASNDGTAGGTCSGDGGRFPVDAFNGCTTSQACVIRFHEVSCCGAYLAIGVNHQAATDYDLAETAWEATCPKCGCPVSPDVIAQDGNMGLRSAVQVDCVISVGASAGKCQTFFN
jgi:hypothetical protein